MGRLLVITGIAMASLVGSENCHAQQLRNVTGMDPGLLVDKLCKGTFDTGRGGENGRGATHLRFFVNGDALAAESRGRLGSEAFRTAASDPFAGSGEVPTEVQGLKVSNSRVTFSNRSGAKYDLTYDRGALVGEVDPRPVAGRENWTIAKVRLVCS